MSFLSHAACPIRRRSGWLASTVLLSAALHAQAPPAAPAATNTRVFHLANVGNDGEAEHIVNAMRNVIDPEVRIFLVTDTHDLVVRGTAPQLESVARLVGELDRPKKAYRLTYTLVESEGGKRIGVQHFSMEVLVGQRISLKQGDKVPVATGSYSGGGVQTQFTYVDVGINLDSTLDQFGTGLRLRSKIEQSSASESVNMGSAQEPVIRQTVLEGTSAITPGKPTPLGGVDIVSSTRHVDVEVVAEPLP